LSENKFDKSIDIISKEVPSSEIININLRYEELKYKESELNLKNLAESVKQSEYDSEKLRLKNKDLQQNITLRKKFAWLILFFVAVWVVSVFGITILAGKYILCFENNVLITILTTTTINIIALLIIVVNYLFPKNDQ